VHRTQTKVGRSTKGKNRGQIRFHKALFLPCCAAAKICVLRQAQATRLQRAEMEFFMNSESMKINDDSNIKVEATNLKQMAEGPRGECYDLIEHTEDKRYQMKKEIQAPRKMRRARK
jgi:predicted metal-binding transcription factor (methanogenesis marker protein 9)